MGIDLYAARDDGAFLSAASHESAKQRPLDVVSRVLRGDVS